MVGGTAFTPANSTILGPGANWYNGSLIPQTRNNQDTGYLGLNQQPDVNLTIYPNNIAGISFPVKGLDINLTFTLAQAIFAPSNYRVGVYCQYPLSGQYDALPRGLFYLLLVFSLLFRRHNWLATAALGTAMTYAAVSAVHMLALVTNFGFGTPDAAQGGWNVDSSKAYGDVDVYGIYPVLSAAAIMLTPILNWSVSVRANEAQMVVVYWGALVFCGVVPAWVYANNIEEWWIDFPLSFALCPTSAAAAHPDCTPDIFLTTTSYDYCQCVDFCGLFSPSTPMRKNANMMASLGRPISELANSSRPLANLEKFNQIVLAVIVVQGILGLIESQFTQAEVRNLVFRALYAEPRDFIILLFEGEREEKLLNKLGMKNPSTKPNTSLRWKLQFQIARLVAAAFFVFAILFAILALAVFVTNIVTNELYLTYWPVSEHSDAVGAWSIWVGAAFVLIAALIVRYHKSWMKSFVISFQAFWRLVAWAGNERHARFQSNDPQPETMRHRVTAFFSEIAIPFLHAWYSTRRALWTINYTMHTFAEWFRDPIKLSKQTAKEAEQIVKYARQQDCPNCQCRMCRRHREAGDGDDEALDQQKTKSSVGERLIQGFEQTYAVKRASRREGEEMEPYPDYGLPVIRSSTTISLPLTGQDDIPNPPAEAQETDVRQNINPPSQFSVPRKPLRRQSGSNEALLVGDNETFPSEPVERDQDFTEFGHLRAPVVPKAGSTGYGRLPSR